MYKKTNIKECLICNGTGYVVTSQTEITCTTEICAYCDNWTNGLIIVPIKEQLEVIKYVSFCTICNDVMKVDKSTIHPTVGGECYYCPKCKKEKSDG